jgi:hypothetical protein
VVGGVPEREQREFDVLDLGREEEVLAVVAAANQIGLWKQQPSDLLAHLDGLHAAGWSVVSHSMTHDSLSTATTGELDFELRLSQEWIQDQGYNGANVFIVPYHDWNATARAAVAQYYEAARGTSANAFVPDSLVSWKPADPYALTGIEAESLPFTSLAGRALPQDLLERTAVEGTFVDIFFHHLDPDDVDEFQATLAVIDQFRDRVLPYHELYPAFARSVF